MSPLAFLGYLADVAILVGYALANWNKKYLWVFNLGNAIGCIPLIIIEVGVGLWQPVILTGFFGIIGWWGLIKERKHATI